jgi:hypothetical protein
MSASSSPEAEATSVGEQTLVPGVRPTSTKERLQARLEAPLMPKKPQKPCDIGLFDEVARKQGSLF